MSKRSLGILFSIIAVDLVGFGIVMPILPFYAARFGASASQLGLLFTVYAAMQFCFAPVWGKLSDRIGRTRVLVGTLFAGSLALVVLGCATNLRWIFIGRALSGIFAANVSVATAYVTDTTTAENRAKGMGLIGAAFGIGFLIGPILGGLLVPFGMAVPIFVAAGLSAVNALVAIRRLPEPARHAHEPAVISPPCRSAVLRHLVTANFFLTASLALLETLLAYFLRDSFGYDAKHVAYYFAVMAAVMGLTQGGLLRWLTKRHSEYAIHYAGLILAASALIVLPHTTQMAWLFLCLIIAVSIGRGLSQPTLMSLASHHASAARRGAVMGIFQSAASLARVAAPLLGGMLYDYRPRAVFWLAGALILPAAATVATAQRKPR